MSIKNSQNEHSVTQYIQGLRNGNQDAAQKIWERFLEQLIRLADRKLRSAPRRSADEEDIVQQAFAQFFAQVEQGRFAKLDDRNDLWQVLAMLVDRRAIDQLRKINTKKAGNGEVRGESIFIVSGAPTKVGIAGIPDMVPTPELAFEMTELFSDRIASLNNDKYREIALLKMQGFTNREIAEQLATSLRTIERRLDQIRSIWSADLES